MKYLKKSIIAGASVLALTLSGSGIAIASPTIQTEIATTSISSNVDRNLSPEQFKSGLDDLLSKGKLSVISSVETPFSETTTYGIVDQKTRKNILTFTTEIPKYKDRIWGAMWGWEPALTFNQTDQTAIATGGAAAVTAMATAAAAILSETVVGSVISAGAIAFVGGAATVYINKYGKCPAKVPTLWVGLITHAAACK